MSGNGYGNVPGKPNSGGGYGNVPGKPNSGGGYGNVPGKPNSVRGYGNVPSGNGYGSVPKGNCAAADAIISSLGGAALSLDLPVDEFARAAAAGGYEIPGSALGSGVSAAPVASNAGGGYGTVSDESLVANPEQDFELACEEAEIANKRGKHAIWDKLHTAFKRDIDSRLAVPSGRNKQLSSVNYVMEGVDSKHRMGDLLSSCLTMYSMRKPPQPFFEWLDSKGEFEQAVLLREAFELASGRTETIKPSTVRSFVRGVAYLDATTNGSYKITIKGGKLYQNGELFDTTGMSTVFSGKGHAIFVQSPSRSFYSASHKLGEFHHSSFLSGAPVRSAGEWVVKQGTVTWLSAKSGHYKPEIYHFVQGIQHLKDQNAINAQTLAQVFDNQGAMNLHAMTLLNPIEAAKWSVWG